MVPVAPGVGNEDALKGENATVAESGVAGSGRLADGESASSDTRTDAGFADRGRDRVPRAIEGVSDTSVESCGEATEAVGSVRRPPPRRAPREAVAAPADGRPAESVIEGVVDSVSPSPTLARVGVLPPVRSSAPIPRALASRTRDRLVADWIAGPAMAAASMAEWRRPNASVTMLGGHVDALSTPAGEDCEDSARGTSRLADGSGAVLGATTVDAGWEAPALGRVVYRTDEVGCTRPCSIPPDEDRVANTAGIPPPVEGEVEAVGGRDAVGDDDGRTDAPAVAAVAVVMVVEDQGLSWAAYPVAGMLNRTVLRPGADADVGVMVWTPSNPRTPENDPPARESAVGLALGASPPPPSPPPPPP